MAAEKDLMIAIELGSSTIRGIAGKKNNDGSLYILDIVHEDASSCIRKGVVYNIDKTVQCLTQIVSKLQDSLNLSIDRVYVGISGKSLRTVKNSVSRQLDTKVVISHELVDGLKDTNLNVNYPDQLILEVIPQEYRIENDFQIDPVGVLSNHIEGRFLNVIARSLIKSNLQKCFEIAGIAVADYFISPLALAESILSETEKRSGCALVDMGHDTTTVAIFKNNILRHLAVIPLGGNNITRDLCNCLQLEEDEARNLKEKYGSAYTEITDEDASTSLQVNNGRSVGKQEILGITEARENEIIANISEQIKISGYGDKLLAGFIITGGGANIKDIETAFSKSKGFEKIKFAKAIQTPITTSDPNLINKSGTLNTLLALLSMGTLSCTSAIPEEIIVQPEDTTVINEKIDQNQEAASEPAPKEEKPKKKWGFKIFSNIGEKISDISKHIVEE